MEQKKAGSFFIQLMVEFKSNQKRKPKCVGCFTCSSQFQVHLSSALLHFSAEKKKKISQAFQSNRIFISAAHSLIIMDLLPQASCNAFLKTISYSSIIHNAVPHNNRLITALLLKTQKVFDMPHNGTSQTAHKPVQQIPPLFPCLVLSPSASCLVEFNLDCNVFGPEAV